MHARSNNSETTCVLLGWSSNCLADYRINPACGVFFTVELIIAKIIIFCDLNRSAVALALGHARAMAISMARGGDGKRTWDAHPRALAVSFDRFTS